MGGARFLCIKGRESRAEERLRESVCVMEKRSRVCVTGAAGYIGSWLVRKLLDKGHTVHATLRNLGDHSKTALLKSLPGADTRLLLFEADIYLTNDFDSAIRGCDFLFHVATPMQHNPHCSKYKDTSEAAVAGARSIWESCRRSGSVKRLIYTGSVTAASPLKDDGTSFEDFINESCWTPLCISYAYCEDLEKSYVISKTLSEKELLSYNNMEADKGGLEVVSLVIGLVGGETLLPYVPSSMQLIVSPLTGSKTNQRQLKFILALMGSIPLVHVDDVCEALIFCMEKSSIKGRVLCASDYPLISEITSYYQQDYPDTVAITDFEEHKKRIESNSRKMTEMGFQYKYDVKGILDESIQCAKRLGELQ